MSELINNRQKRIETLKGLIRQLHLGVAEAEVKATIEQLLPDLDYSDVFTAEMQLIQEGIPPQSIQQLCDAHTRVLRAQLDRQQAIQMPVGHPLHTFLQENRELRRVTSQARDLIQQVGALPDEQEATDLMRSIQQRLNDLTDVHKHYLRKEYLLFPHFERNNLMGPPTVMWGKHDETRHLLRQAIALLQSKPTFTAAEAQEHIQQSVLPALDAIEEMIYKEEKILFPVALSLLTEQDWYEIYLQSDEYGYCLYVPEAEWVPEGGVQMQIRQPMASDGRIRMPTGSLTLEELIAVMGTLPFDLTFVDRDDTVRYFSPGKKRIFSRSKAILGRKVQYCHPPKSVYIVDQILSDFKSGKQDRARFWINLHGRLVYICYYAVRNEQGEYLGTLEVTQDLTEVRSLEGERRLLMYDDQQADSPHS